MVPDSHQDALSLVLVDVSHLHHLQRRQECFQGDLMSLHQQAYLFE
jgi:hypothetical protein